MTGQRPAAKYKYVEEPDGVLGRALVLRWALPGDIEGHKNKQKRMMYTSPWYSTSSPVTNAGGARRPRGTPFAAP